MEASVFAKPVPATHASVIKPLPQRLRRPRLQRLLPTQRASAVFAKQVAIAAVQRIASAANATVNSV